MAEFASYLNKAHQSYARPSIFDLLAQESLKSSLRPAFEFLTRTLATSYPEYFRMIFKYSDELFYSLMILVERHYLWKYSATFSENFYGLCRRSLQRSSNGALSLRQKVASLIVLVVLPYLRCKVEKLYYKLKERTMSEQYREGPMRFLEKCFYSLFPYIDSLVEATKLTCTICYIIHLINFHSITYACLRVGLTYSTSQENEPQMSSRVHTSSDVVQSNSINTVRFIYEQLVAGLSFAVEHALPTSVFFLKFLEWWHTNENNTQDITNTLPIPPPPREFKVIFHVFNKNVSYF